MSKKGFEVRNTFDTLFCDVELLPSAEKTLESINFDDLAQVLRHDAKAVYVYATWTKNKTGCEYRGELLFPFPATLLQSAPYMIARTESGIITIASYLIRTRYSAHLCPEYMKYFMESQLYWDQLHSGTIATAQPNCNGKTLSRMVLPLPPLAEQKRIVARLEELLPLCERLK